MLAKYYEQIESIMLDLGLVILFVLMIFAVHDVLKKERCSHDWPGCRLWRSGFGSHGIYCKRDYPAVLAEQRRIRITIFRVSR